MWMMDKRPGRRLQVDGYEVSQMLCQMRECYVINCANCQNSMHEMCTHMKKLKEFLLLFIFIFAIPPQSLIFVRRKASNRLADEPINRLFTCRAALFSVIG
jgi:hypothetical protein